MTEEQVKEIIKGMIIPVATTLYVSKGITIKEAVSEAKELLKEVDVKTLISEINEVV